MNTSIFFKIVCRFVSAVGLCRDLRTDRRRNDNDSRARSTFDTHLSIGKEVRPTRCRTWQSERARGLVSFSFFLSLHTELIRTITYVRIPNEKFDSAPSADNRLETRIS